MGRWGMRLFEGDRDLDIVLEINSAFGDSDDEDLHLSAMVHQTDMLAPAEAKAFYETDEYQKELEATVCDRRKTLDSGVGRQLFKIFRRKEHEPNGKYRVIIVGAIMLRAGAVIKDDDFNHLRELVADVPCRDGLTPALRGISGKPSALRLIAAGRDDKDNGFRYPGKVQFLAALEHYKPGVPRSFQEPSCYNCGNIAVDNGGAALAQCSKCKRVWYCNAECQSSHSKNHQSACIPPESLFSVNV